MTCRSFFFVCLFSILTAAGLLQAGPARAAETAPTPTQVVEKLHDTLITAMKGGAKLGFDGRAKTLDPVVRDAFDLPTMARVASGGAWSKLSDADKTRVSEAFAKFTVANYAGQFKDFSGEKFVIKQEVATPRGRAVNTQLVPNGEDPVDLNYQLRQDASGKWKIVDVLLDGSISQLAMRRNEFAATLANGGADNLIAQMQKTEEAMRR